MAGSDASLAEAGRLRDMLDAGDPYAAAVRATRMPIAITDARLPDNPIVFANRAFIALTGYADDEIIGRNCRFLQGPETDRAEVARIAAAIAAGDSVAAEILNYRKDGSAFWNALYVSPVFAPDGRITHFFGSQLDVTDRKRHAQALRDANADLLRAKASAEDLAAARTQELSQALDQKTAVVHEMDHRVKNNLQLIASLIQMQVRGASDETTRTTLKSLLGRVSALAAMYRNVSQRDDVATFDVATFARDIATDRVGASEDWDGDLVLELEPAAIPAARAAPIALVLNELMEEALQRGRPGGRIRLAVALDESDVVVELEDDGAARDGPPAPAGGSGGALVDLLVRQLSARIERNGGAQGARTRVTLPPAHPPSTDRSG